MQKLNEVLRNMPQIDEILRSGELDGYTCYISKARILETVRRQADRVRKHIIAGDITVFDRKGLTDKIIRMSVKQLKLELTEKSGKVINGTGVIIHTNLGRSPLSEKAAKAAYRLSKEYSNLEYGTSEGKRSRRGNFVEKQITGLTGAEAAIVVNNNAAAVYLALNSICRDKEVIVSRGEIVEIGGSFRISEIVETSGCIVKETGTTNKTYLSDIQKAAGANTGLLLKMHTSNFKVVGFTASVEAKELVDFGIENHIPVMEDMGSGVLFDLRDIGLKYERRVQDAVKDGVDIITFSGDKMLGGPQCGIIIGKKRYLDEMRKNQLMRCFRVDKLCLFALEATLSHYFTKSGIMEIPIYSKMGMPLETVKNRAEALKAILDNPKINVLVKPHNAEFGGGSLPFETIKSYAVYVTSEYISASTMDAFLRSSQIPVIGTVQNGEYILDLRTVYDKDFEYLGTVFKEMIE